MKAKLIKIKDIKASANEGFTLIELLVVIGILAILMGIVLIAINPAHQFALANDTNRRNAVAQILSGVGQYEAEHNGSLPPSLSAVTATPVAIASPTGAGKADLCADLVAGTVPYLPGLPADPTTSSSDISGWKTGNDITGTAGSCGTYNSGYTVAVDPTTKRVTIAATPETATAITVTR